MPRTFLSARWENLIMANFAVDPNLLMPYLPKGVELDYHNNQTYVSLVGFMFKDIRLFQMPIPFFGTFEEINLRFYVKRVHGQSIKRGVVFINETVPYKLVAWLANKLYKEHYIAIPTKNQIIANTDTKIIKYEWQIKNQWNYLQVNTTNELQPMSKGSIEEFIFEHYFGYTKINSQISQEYKVNHPRWKVNRVLDFDIQCNFDLMYGNDFSILNQQKPHSVIIAEGSSVSVDWERHKF